MQIKKTKTAIVRQILQEIGAVYDSPPNWMETVKDAIAKREGSEKDKQINKITVYQIRKKLREEAGMGQNSVSAKNLTVETLQAISIFAKKIGGMEVLAEGIKTLQSFK